MKLDVIHVDNGSDQYPGSFAVIEQKIIKKYLKNPSLHLFSGRSTIGTVRVDFACEEATIHADVFDYLEQCTQKFNTVILDPPYNEKFAKKYDEIAKTAKQFIIFADTERTTRLFAMIRKLDPEIIIVKSWNYYIVEGYDLLAGFVCYAGGYRKPCFLLIEKRGGVVVSFWRNQFKTFAGWLVGIPLLTATCTLSPILVSTILCVFYAFFYTFLDALLKHLEQYIEDRRSGKYQKFWRGLY